MSARRVRRMDGYHVTAAQELVELHQGGVGVSQRRVVDEQFGAESAQPPADGAADRAVADDPDRRAVQLRAEQREVAPATAAHLGVLIGQAPQRGEHQRERVVGDRLVVGAGGHGDRDAGGRRGREVDRVEADAGAGDDAQLGQLGERRRVERIGVGDHRHRAAAQLDELIGGPVAFARMNGQFQARLSQRAAALGVVEDVAPVGDENPSEGGHGASLTERVPVVSASLAPTGVPLGIAPGVTLRARAATPT
jgi:hypothetical protein